MFAVQVAARVHELVHELFGEERSATGRPSEYDFVGGPLAAALIEFAHFEDLPEVVGPSVRSVTTVDSFFGPVTFVGVLVGDELVEIAEFSHDPDYWHIVATDPDAPEDD